ncbi:LacI family DNA-binding transcriptional regulator [Streptomyces sp. NPDC018693]|uniref:LacI family DNA-binding transcriptional regulator n=1 Tax=unclassified Streptomyces TaxID=2593676 RepID=UPI0037AB05AF
MPDNRSEGPSADDRGERRTGPASVTVAYIAESAGVSSRVSKVLNGRSGVSDETRARVEQLIHQHGYRKPPKSRSNVVELVFRELDHMWSVEIIRGVERVDHRRHGGAAAPGRSVGGPAHRGRATAVAWMDPPLTTVHQPPAEMAGAAIELALALGRGEEVPQTGLEIATTLTVRESTDPPKAE